MEVLEDDDAGMTGLEGSESSKDDVRPPNRADPSSAVTLRPKAGRAPKVVGTLRFGRASSPKSKSSRASIEGRVMEGAFSKSPKSSSSSLSPMGASGLASKLSEKEDWKANELEATVGRKSSCENEVDLEFEASAEKGPQSPSCAGEAVERNGKWERDRMTHVVWRARAELSWLH